MTFKEFRLSQKETQNEMSKKLDISQEYLSQLENNKRKPTLELLDKLIKVYQLNKEKVLNFFI